MIMYLEVVKGLNIRFIDSLNFFPMKLAALPKAFGIQEMKKRYFPHIANTPPFWSYVGPYLHPYFYDVDTMMPEEKTKFQMWHSEMLPINAIFDFRRKMMDYCRSDVAILKEDRLKYRDLCLESVGLDPFTCVTVASVTSKVFNTRFLPEVWELTMRDGSNLHTVLKDGQFPDGIKE